MPSYCGEQSPCVPKTVPDGIIFRYFSPYFITPLHGNKMTYLVCVLSDWLTAFDLLVDLSQLLLSARPHKVGYYTPIHRLQERSGIRGQRL